MESQPWEIDKDNPQTVVSHLDSEHVLYITRTKGGLTLKVYKIKNGKEVIYYSSVIGKTILGL
jgi:hypothetical protein